MAAAAGLRAFPTRLPRRSTLYDEIVEFGDSLRVPTGDLVGEPWTWRAFQLDWLRRTFGGGRHVRRSILSIGRRNGKTATVAVVVLAALFGPLVVPNSLILSASRSREQAAIVFDYAVKMIRISGLSDLVIIREARKEIECKLTGVIYRAISADATRAVGFGARLVIHDELGQVEGPRDKLFEALATSLGSYEGSLEIIISTQASTDNDLLSMLLDDALAGHDAETVCCLYSVPPDADPFDPDQWAAANPAMGHHRSRSDVQRLSEEARRLPAREASFRNLILNQRVALEAHFLTASVWKACAGEPDLDLLREGDTYWGLDLSSRQDLTSLVIVAEDDQELLHTLCFSWKPADTLSVHAHRDRAPYELWREQGYIETFPGVSLDYGHLAERIAELAQLYPPATVNFDRWRIGELRENLARVDCILPLRECGQGFRDQTVALEATTHAALAAQIRHGANPVLTWAISNARVLQDPAGNQKLDKRNAYRRIDPAVALVMAIKAARPDREPGGLEDGMLWL